MRAESTDAVTLQMIPEMWGKLQHKDPRNFPDLILIQSEGPDGRSDLPLTTSASSAVSSSYIAPLSV